MSKVTLSDLANLSNATTAVTTINTNTHTISSSFDNTLSRDGTTPNQMGANLDMNSNRIINLPAPGSPNDAARFVDLTGAAAITSGVITGSSANLAYFTGTAVVGGANKATYVDGTGTLTLSNINVTSNLIINQTTTSLSSSASAGNTLFQISAPDATNTIGLIDTFNGISLLAIRRADGTNAARTALQSGDEIGRIAWQGYNGTSYVTTRASVIGLTAETWTTSANGTYLQLNTTPTGTTGLVEAMRVNASGGVSIGTTTDAGLGSLLVNSSITAKGSIFSSSAVTINQNTTSLPTSLSTGAMLLQLAAADSTATIATIDSFGGNSLLALRRADGTNASKTALQSGDVIGLMSFQGYTGTSYTAGRAFIEGVASENWTTSNNGTEIRIITTPLGTTAIAEVMRIQASGGVSVGTALDPGAGSLVTASSVLAGFGSLGYFVGAGVGSSIIQPTSKTTNITMNTVTGQITMNNSALSSATGATFTLTNSKINVNDLVVILHSSGGTNGAYQVNAFPNSTGASIIVVNRAAATLSEAIVLSYAVIKGTIT